MKPFLTVYTPTFRRPTWLARCKESVDAQGVHFGRVQHLIIEDTIGLGVGGMYADVRNHHEKIEGEWVYFLSDDDVMAPGVVQKFRKLVDSGLDADVVIGPFRIGQRLFPTVWKSPPKQTHITLGNWIVKRHVHESIPYGNRYEGDFDFIAEAYWRFTVHWWPYMIGHAQSGPHKGRPENDFPQ